MIYIGKMCANQTTLEYFLVVLFICFHFQSGESRMIFHFHYTTWPDFGVPESPASFLNFLFKVRESGSLSPEHGPAVIHCSAGIGRSGTFSLVDTFLVLVSIWSLSLSPFSFSWHPASLPSMGFLVRRLCLMVVRSTAQG